MALVTVENSSQPIDPEKPNKSEKPRLTLSQKLKQPKVYVPIILAVLILPLIGSQIYRYAVGGQQDGGNKPNFGFLKTSEEEKLVVSPLDGLRYPEDVANRHALGVMIENHPESRPQEGLADAGVVYEAEAEGGITRFLAIFGPKAPERVGPVRSARTYYLDWCLEYDCFYAHVGGNSDALALIPKIGIKDMDQFRYGVRQYNNTFYRVPKKGVAIEHTMFGEPAKLWDIAINQNKWPATGGFPTVDFKSDEAKDKRGVAQTIDIEISSRQFNTSWTYDPTTNSYKRSMGGAIHKDGKSGNQIESKVLIVQEIPNKPVISSSGKQVLSFNTVGSGKATIFQDGKQVTGTWKKEKQKERTIFYDETGEEIRYTAGQRWVTVVTPGSKVTVTNTPAASPSP